MNLNLLLNNVYYLSNMFARGRAISIIAPILIGIVSFVMLVVFIVAFVRINKIRKKHFGSFFDGIEQWLQDEEFEENDNQFVECDYCGSANKLDKTTCEKCGAGLNKNKKDS